MKKLCGAFGFTVLVTLKFPPVNVFVTRGVHWPKGNATLVLISTANGLPLVPFVPLITRLVPDKLMLVMCGCDTPFDTTLKMPLDKLFVFHASPAPGVAGTMLLNAPL